MNVPTTIVLGAAMIAAGIVGTQLVPRYEISPAPVGASFYRVNVSTGTIDICHYRRDPLVPASRETVQCIASF